MEFAPSSRGKKPVSKSQINKLKAAFVEWDKLAKANREREEAEKWTVEDEMEDLLSGV